MSLRRRRWRSQQRQTLEGMVVHLHGQWVVCSRQGWAGLEPSLRRVCDLKAKLM
jgi:hypothetical protein